MNVSRPFSDPAPRNPVQAKDTVIFNGLCSGVDEFKKFLSEQKKHREELVNLSYNLLISLKDELNTTSHHVSAVVSGIRTTSTAISRLKTDVLKEEKNVGIAHKTSERSVNVQAENNDLTSYFLKKITEFDTRMRLYKQELEIFEDNVYSQPYSLLTPKDLLNVLSRMDHDYINLAAQLYTTNEAMKALKAQYLKKYRIYHGTNRNPFGDSDEDYPRIRCDSDFHLNDGLMKIKKGVSSTPYGPSPFTISADSSVSSSVTGSTLSGPAVVSSATPISTFPLSGFSVGISPVTSIGISQPSIQFGTSTTQSSNLFKPTFGSGTNLTTSSSGLSLFGQPTNSLTLPTTTSTPESPFNKRFAS